MQNNIVIIDYGMGNLRSVQKKLNRISTDCTISADPEVIATADKLILPGVGHFANGVKNLKKSGIWDVLNERVKNGQTPILGICLGMQLMANSSEEGNEEGLGWFDAEVKKFSVSDSIRYKVPHMGWNTAVPQKKSPLTDGLDDAFYYFVHSYHMISHNPEDILTSTSYDYEFTSAVSKGHIFGVQFHPEKSHEAGEQLLRNFVNYNPQNAL